MYVVATAGHVDHGKSTLVRALTSMDPDRWEEEKRRGLTIDLGFVWTTLPSGADLAFVDVPGHERFLGNMLAGLGPAPVVMLVVAADEGWRAQSADHRDAIRALGLEHGVVVLTRADRADAARRAEVAAQVRGELAGTGLADAPVVTVSAVTGEGLDELRRVLDEVLAAAPAPELHARVRLWIDRAFSVKGAGTVVTGTLTAGTVCVGDELTLLSTGAPRRVEVRGVQSENAATPEAGPVRRVAVNLRGVDAEGVHRGDQLLTPGAWPQVRVVDVARRSGTPLGEVPAELVAHVGAAAVEVRVRPLGDDFARVTLARPLALALGDRLVLRGPGARHVLGGLEVVDLDPPVLERRGAAARRAAELAAQEEAGHADPQAYIQRRGAVRVTELEPLGLAGERPAAVIEFAGWWIYAPQVTAWKEALLAAVERHAAEHPLAAGLPRAEAIARLGLPGDELLGLAVAAAKLESVDGVVRRPGAPVNLGAAEDAVADIERRLGVDPFAAPEARDLQALRLGPKELAAAERAGRLVRIADGIVLTPAGVGEARRILGELAAGLSDGVFTTSEARQALGTTRRVAIPLLEYFDAQGVTRRLDGGHRQLRG
ncbi:selenocysteine-specific translation elongation factor [uncultured Corynebacterium sp.]|uniref:selenocysteine-specific translation elongation factor n=1 Tax=uncultured Corynebacterium sp. TaxID=159447 RepID=UPI0025E42573|nr:selenocysteine-specific translation elongation factor [uncultured Corynebacterium sp.]